MESVKISKFLSYTKKFLAMSFFSLILSMSLSSKDVFAVDPAKVTTSNNGLTYTDSAQPKVSYELSSDKKSFSAIVGDEGSVVYSQASYTQDGKDVKVPVTSISVGNSGVSSFTLNLVDTKNDKVKIVPSEHGDLTITLKYDGSLSKSNAISLFNGTELDKNNDIVLGGDSVTKILVRKPANVQESYDQSLGSEDLNTKTTDNTNQGGNSNSSSSNSSESNNSSTTADSSTTNKETSSSSSTTSYTNVTSTTSSGATTTKSTNSSTTSSGSTKKSTTSSGSAAKSASTKTSDASLIPLSLLACSGASVLFFRKKD